MRNNETTQQTVFFEFTQKPASKEAIELADVIVRGIFQKKDVVLSPYYKWGGVDRHDFKHLGYHVGKGHHEANYLQIVFDSNSWSIIVPHGSMGDHTLAILAEAMGIDLNKQPPRCIHNVSQQSQLDIRYRP